MKCILLAAMPLLAQQTLSFEKERVLGSQLALEVRKQSRPVSNPAIEAYLNHVGTALTKQLKGNYRFEAIANEDRTEPIALPGGHVFIPIQSLAVAEDEASFVISVAHAIGHVELRHGFRQGPGGSISLVFMGGWMPAHASSRDAQMLMPRGSNEEMRGNESEAEQFGVDLAARAGYGSEVSSDEFRQTQEIVRSLVKQPEPRQAPSLRR